MRIREQQLGPESEGIAQILHDFAGFWQVQGHLQEAVRLYQQALLIREHVLGADHPMTVVTCNYLQEELLALHQLKGATMQ
ncbi:hypothetical protein KSB_65110 [Ktedonobacter robiniae]|uniref:Tetratricopeptide repeat protein n=1 Tax=Ktedonobacter robiniae TaxID=2778365 RepID=A0ABQ3UZ96_9CHLR|nr:hypothetical protein KSB_65110 [Ktedonobacter robiniae]